MPTRRRITLAASVLAATLCVSACGGDDDTEDSDDTGASAPVTVEIHEHDGTIEPSGETVEVEQGQQIQFVVTSDVDDEIHVHSTPEHEFEVAAGADAEELEPFTITTPGTVEVESHGLEVVIVKLQVS